MTQAIQAAASALQAEQVRFDVSANNTANVNTAGFRSSRVSTTSQAGLGGVTVSGTSLSTQQGPLARTFNPTDLAISGSGYFRIQGENGDVSFTRNGSFSVDSNGFLRSGGGYLLGDAGPLRVASNFTNITVSPGGTVSYTDGGGIPNVAGTISLGQFSNDSGLAPIGGGFAATAASGAAQLSAPGQNGAGTITSGAVEMSNTDFVSEAVTSLLAQRSFEANTSTIRASDEMLKTITGMKK